MNIVSRTPPGANLSSPETAPLAPLQARPTPPPAPGRHCPGGFPFLELHVPGIPLRVSPSSGLSTWPNILTFIRLVAHVRSFFLFAVKCIFREASSFPEKSQLAAFLPAMSRNVSFSESLPALGVTRVLPAPQMKVRPLLLPEFAFPCVSRVRVFYFHLFMAVLGPVAGSCGVSLVAAGRGLWGARSAAEAARGSAWAGVRSAGSAVVPQSCRSPACGICPDQVWLHASCAGREVSSPLSHQGSGVVLPAFSLLWIVCPTDSFYWIFNSGETLRFITDLNFFADGIIFFPSLCCSSNF